MSDEKNNENPFDKFELEEVNPFGRFDLEDPPEEIEQREGAEDELRATAGGINYGISALAGAPVDAVNYLLREGERNVRSTIRSATDPDTEYGEGTRKDRRGQTADSPVVSDDELFFGGPAFGGSASIRAGLNEAGIDTPSRDDVDPTLRPFYEAGKVIGENVLPFAGTTAAAIRGAGKMHPLFQFIRNNPKASISAELGATAGGAQAVFLADLFYPDNPYVRAGAEVIGSLVTPTSAVTSAPAAGKNAVQGVRRFVRTQFGGQIGAEAEAVSSLTNALKRAGVDPAEVSNVLDSALQRQSGSGQPSTQSLAAGREVRSADLTAGQLSGNDALLAIEKELSRTSREFASFRDGAMEDAFAALRQMTDRISRSSADGADEIAEGLRKQYFRDILDVHLKNTGEAASAAASRFDDTDIAGASRAATEVLQRSRQQVRAVENSLWSQIDRDIPVKGENLKKAFGKLRSELMPEESSPELIERFLVRLNDPEQAATSGDLLTFRSRMLAKARDARAKPGGGSEARQYEILARGALDDLSEIPGEAANIARNFSFELNERFTSRFPQQALATGQDGRPRIRPEQVLDRGFGGGSTQARESFGELTEATRFSDEAAEAADAAARAEAAQQGTQPRLIAGDSGGDETARLLDDMQRSQESYLRGRAGNLRAPDGTVSERRFSKFLTDNEDLLSEFPSLRADVEDAATSAAAVDDTQRVFGSLARPEDPSVIVGRVLNSDRPQEGFTRLAEMAAKDGPETLSGMRMSAFDWANGAATNARGEFDFLKFGQSLIGSKTPNGRSVVDLMVDNNIMTADEAKAVTSAIAEGIRLDALKKNAADVDTILGPESDLVKNFSRILGANVFSRLGVASSAGASLQEAQLGANFFGKLISRTPADKTQDAMRELLRRPEDLAIALRNSPDSPAAQKRIRDRVGDAISGYVVGRSRAAANATFEVEGEQAEEFDDTQRMLEEEQTQ